MSSDTQQTPASREAAHEAPQSHTHSSHTPSTDSIQATLPAVSITPSTPPQTHGGPSSHTSRPDDAERAQQDSVAPAAAAITSLPHHDAHIASEPGQRQDSRLHTSSTREPADLPSSTAASPAHASSSTITPSDLHSQSRPSLDAPLAQPQPSQAASFPAYVDPTPTPSQRAPTPTDSQRDNAPPLPPKPPQYSPPPTASSSATVRPIYVPTPIDTSIAAQLPSPGPSGTRPHTRSPSPLLNTSNASMPGTFPSSSPPGHGSILQSQVLPMHQVFQQQQQQQQSRRLSWDEHATTPPPPRRPNTADRDRASMHIQPLTLIGSGPYPPLTGTPSPIENAHRNGYFTPPSGNGSGGGNGNGGLQRPQRAHSQHTSSSHRQPAERDPQRRSSYPLSHYGDADIAYGQPGAFDAPPRREHRRGSSRRSGVDLSQIPVLEEGGDDGEGSGHGSGRGSENSMREKKRMSMFEGSFMSRERTIEQRLGPTLENAKEELRKARTVAKATGWSLNVAIGAQVVLGALTTGVAAATTGRQTSIATSILGGLSTLAASYLAKARGSGEPEASSLRCKDLENFTRELENTCLDRGALVGSEYDDLVHGFRSRFEEIMGHAPSSVSMSEMLKKGMHGVQEHLPQFAQHVPQFAQQHLPAGWAAKGAAEAEGIVQDVEGYGRKATPVLAYGQQLGAQVAAAREQMRAVDGAMAGARPRGGASLV